MIKLLETTLPSLVAQTNLTFPTTTKRLNAPTDAKLSNVRFIPAGTKLVVKAAAAGISGHYDTVIQLNDVDFSDEGDVNFVSGGKTYTMSSIDPDGVDVQVGCSCLDFRFRFAYYNHQDGSLFGVPPQPYTPVPGSTKPPANPRKTPGVCKHVLALFQHLQHMRVVKG